MALNKEEINLLTENISALAEINILSNLRVFLTAMEKEKIPQEQILIYFKTWLDMSISACHERVGIKEKKQ